MLESATIVGQYRILGPLGRGGMAVVYEAEDLSVDRRVALKLLGGELSRDPEFVARFRREATVQASLEHPHVVPVYETGESEHGLFIAMRLIRGPTLAELIRERALGAGRALRLLGQTAEALDAAHAAGLVHRDVKPQNVLVGERDHAYLADFGVTRLGEASAVTVTGGLVGTLAYLAPEIIRGGPATAASDRYALAAMLFECLCGEMVFPRASEAALLYAHTSEPPPRLSLRRSELPGSLDDLLIAALAKDPAKRPTSAGALVEGVAEALGPERSKALGPPAPRSSAEAATTVVPLPFEDPPRRPTRRERRRGWLLVAAGGVLRCGDRHAGLRARAGRERVATRGVAPAGQGRHRAGQQSGLGRRTVDCRGRPPGAAAPACTIFQAQLQGRTLIAPRECVIRRWTVRGARGEIALQVLDGSGGSAHQIALSSSEIVPDARPHTFAANLAVERGNTVAIKLLPGAAIGVRHAPGATTQRWTGPLTGNPRPPSLGPGTGLDDEVLLGVDVVPGGHLALPARVIGPEAARLPAGRVTARKPFRFADGRPAKLALVELPGRLVLDLFARGRRVARMDLPDMRPGGRLLSFNVDHTPPKREEVGIFVEYVNADSARILSHYYLVRPLELEYIN